MAFSAEIVGYMIGDVQTTSITIWVGIKAKYKSNKLPDEVIDIYPSTAKVTYYPSSDTSNRTDVNFPLPLKAVRCGETDYKNLAYEGTRLPLTGLQSDTRYGYEIHISGHHGGDFGITIPFSVTGLSFKTAPEQQSAFSVMFSSCQKAKGGEESRDTIQAPWSIAFNSGTPLCDLNILLGDTHYANSHERNKKWSYSISQFGIADYQNLIANVPTYAIYDDHDFISGDLGGDTVKGNKNTKYGKVKERASRYFDGLWIIPIPHERTRNEGCFHYFSYANVHFFMLDVLYYSTQNPDDIKSDDALLGDKQWIWLKTLLNSLEKDEIKVICSGTTMFNGVRGWDYFPEAKAKLDGLLIDHSKVLIASGDVHYTKFKKPKGDRKYSEIISSGIGRLNSHHPDDPEWPAWKRTHGFAIAKFDGAGEATIELYNSDEDDPTTPYKSYSNIFNNDERAS